MSTSAEVETAWAGAIWNHATITAITSKIHAFDIADSHSEAEDTRLRYGKEINFIQYLVVRANKYGETAETLGRVVSYEFTVQVIHMRAADVADANWGRVRDFFDTLFGLVVTELGAKWDDTVDYWRPQDGAPRIDQISIDNTPVWRGLYEFRGVQSVTI